MMGCEEGCGDVMGGRVSSQTASDITGDLPLLRPPTSLGFSSL